MDKVYLSHFISFSRYQTKCDIKFLFKQSMTSMIYFGSTSKALADREKKKERQKYKKNKKRTKKALQMK